MVIDEVLDDQIWIVAEKVQNAWLRKYQNGSKDFVPSLYETAKCHIERDEIRQSHRDLIYQTLSDKLQEIGVDINDDFKHAIERVIRKALKNVFQESTFEVVYPMQHLEGY
jgi:ribosome maturation factor RimP